jgi:hypothetical protein
MLAMYENVRYARFSCEALARMARQSGLGRHGNQNEIALSRLDGCRVSIATGRGKRSSLVRNAPLATLGHRSATCRDGPQAAYRAAKKIGVKARHAAPTAIGCRSSRGRSLMRRREFIAGLGSAAAWPLAARAQQAERIRRIGLLISADENDPSWKPRLSAFTQALADLGWIVGRNVRMDLRWAGGDNNRIRALAQELVGLQPDIILASATPPTAALQRETRTITLDNT